MAILAKYLFFNEYYMTVKERIHLEYVFDKVSKNILWNHLTTPTGLADWFADDVSLNGNNFVFSWNKSPQEAEKIGGSHLSHIRFRWLEEDDSKAYFEFRIHTVELTGSIALEIVDFVSPEERQEAITLWDSQVKVLKRTLGI